MLMIRHKFGKAFSNVSIVTIVHCIIIHAIWLKILCLPIKLGAFKFFFVATIWHAQLKAQSDLDIIKLQLRSQLETVPKKTQVKLLMDVSQILCNLNGQLFN